LSELARTRIRISFGSERGIFARALDDPVNAAELVDVIRFHLSPPGSFTMMDLLLARLVELPICFSMGDSAELATVDGLRRKLRAVAALVEDPAATAHEKANATALKARLEQRLREAGWPAGDWTDNVFRLGRWAKAIGKSTSSVSPNEDWTENARRLGKALRRGYKRWLSD
jgi:hypothetical protein